MEKINCFVSTTLLLLKERNSKEQRFSEIISYSNRLLESVDYLQKENINKKLVNTKSEDSPESHDSAGPKTEDISMLMKCCSLQQDLAESHKKISEYAVQIIDFKNLLDEKHKLIETQALELQQSQDSIKHCKELCRTYCQQIETLKSTLQNKKDECDTLNITYSSLDNKRNDLEIENKILRKELLGYKSRELASLSSESNSITVSGDSKAEKIVNRKVRSEMSKQLQATVLSKQLQTTVSSKQMQAAALPKKTDFIKTGIAASSDTTIPTVIKHEFDAHDTGVNCIFWVPFCPQLITAGADRKVKLWNMDDNSMVLKNVVRDCNSAIMSVDLDINARLLLCASCDFASRLWTVDDFTIRHTLTGHSGTVMSAKFLQIKNQIISGSVDQTLKLWDLRKSAHIQSFSTGSSVNDVVSRSGHTVISCHANGHINFWDIRKNESAACVPCSAGVTSLDIASNEYLLLASQVDNKLALIDIRNCKEVCSLFGVGFEVGCDWTRARFSPDNQYCCCGSKNGSIFIWNINSGTVTRELKAHPAPVIACSWSSCSSYLASCDSKKKCIIWSNK